MNINDIKNALSTRAANVAPAAHYNGPLVKTTS